jgi:nicotinate phosphoribosyltransferase
VVSSSSQDQGLAALDEAGARPLQVLLVDEGRIVEKHRGKEALSAAAERHRSARAELPYDAWRLSDGESALQTRHVDLNGQGAIRR